jgi:putative DNA primase/helicase
MLRGARLVTASETEEGRAWAESRIKQLTGGDPITARFMKKDFFTFRPQFKLVIIGNHRPVLNTVDEAARRRFAIVPFTRKPEAPDPELEQKLKDEWPGILRWAIEGCLIWQKDGLVRPEIVLAETASYFDDQDLAGQWLRDECDLEPGNSYKWERSEDLFNSWSRYATEAGERAGTKRAFSDLLEGRGIARKRSPKARGFQGIKLLNKDRRPDPDFDR